MCEKQLLIGIESWDTVGAVFCFQLYWVDIQDARFLI